MAKRNYEQPELSLLCIFEEDVVRTSNQEKYTQEDCFGTNEPNGWEGEQW